MAFAKRLYLIAGIYGVIVLAPQYFMEAQVGHDYPPPITHPEFFYGFVGTALAFQILFLIVARDPLRYRAMMIPSVLEKAGFGIASVVLFMQQRASAMTLGFGTVDLILGVLFAVAYIRTGSEGRGSQRLKALPLRS
jgi:hypothetical protein